MRRFLKGLVAALLALAPAVAMARTGGDALILFGKPKPALDLNLAATGAFPSSPSVTFSRASTATYTNSTGVLTTASSGVPRFTYDPTTITPLGYLSEAAATSIQLHSQFDSGWSVTGGTLTANNVTSPDGSSDAATFTEDTSTGLHAPNITATTTITANTVYTGSMWLKAGTRTNAVLSWENAGPTDAVRVNVNLSACTVSAGSVVGTGVISGTPASQQWPNGWCRVFIAGTINAASTAAFLIPYGANPAGTVSYTGTSATFFAFGADIKLGADYSSYIPTTTASVTRSADVATVALSSTSIPANPSALTIIGKAKMNAATGTSDTRLVSLSDGTVNNRFIFYRAANTTIVTTMLVSGGAVQTIPNTATLSNGQSFKFWLTAAPNDFAAQVIGNTKVTAGVITLPTGLTTLGIGINQSSAQQWNSTIARLQIYNTRLSDGRASAIAAGM